jgi:hypothetical protein
VASALPTQSGGAPQATPSGTADTTPDPIATPDLSAATPLPEPSLTEPSDIADALFDPARVADGVVSLVDAMGVAIYDAEGTLLKAGADRGAGELSLTDDEVRGLVEMTAEDLAQIGELGGPFPLADMYAGLESGLPAEYSLEEFAAAYDDAYQAEPESLAAQVMRSQRIRTDSGVLRIQMWLLLIDGFIGPSDEATGNVTALLASGPVGRSVGQLPRGNTLGVARQNLPALTSPAPALTTAEWAELMSRMPTLPWNVPFESFKFGGGGGFHEGHGDLGDGRDFGVLMGQPAPLVSQRTGRVLLNPLARPGVAVTWNSDESVIWDEHGAFDDPLGRPMTLRSVAPAHGALIHYTPRQEDANGSGTILQEWVNLYATADQLDLVLHAYDLGAIGGHGLQLISGRVRAETRYRYFPIEWHQKGNGYFVKITWTDIYDDIPDTIIFRGFIDQETTAPAGVDKWLTGVGKASGRRPGLTACNPGFDVVPSGSGRAFFEAGIQGNEVTIAAFPAIEHPLGGIFAGPFILPVEGGTLGHVGLIDDPNALCPHSLRWFIEAIRFGDP